MLGLGLCFKPFLAGMIMIDEIVFVCCKDFVLDYIANMYWLHQLTIVDEFVWDIIKYDS